MKPNLQDIDLRLLKVFRMIADARSLTRAAAAMNTSVPVISNHLSNLEIRLGFPLCRRGRSGFSLTDEGTQVYYAHSELLKDLEHFSNRIGEISGSLVGQVRLAIISDLSESKDINLEKAIRVFKDRSPYTTISVEVHPARVIEELLAANSIDIGISVFQREQEGIDQVVLCSEQIGLFCGDHHLLFHKEITKKSVEYIESFDRCYRDYIHFVDGLRRKKTEVHTAKANDLEVIALMILSGRFLGHLPQSFARRWIANGRMRSILPEVYQKENYVVLLTRQGEDQSKAVTTFLKDLREAISTARKIKAKGNC